MVIMLGFYGEARSLTRKLLFETWVLVQNPGASPVEVNLILQTSSGELRHTSLQFITILPLSRRSFRLNTYLTDWDVSTKVEATGPVICERAVYGGKRTWAHDSVGVTTPATTWYLAEGCTQGGFETWVLVQNSSDYTITVNLTFMTSTGPQAGPQGVVIPPGFRKSFNVGAYVTDWNVSTKVEAFYQ